MTDWYKIKRVLIWQNWEEKQIYPAPIFSYEYDFRNKNATTVQSDWWTIDNISYAWFDSNWVYCTTTTVANLRHTIGTSLSNAKKIIYKMTIYYPWTHYNIWCSFRSYTNNDNTYRYWIINNQDSYDAKFWYELAGWANYVQNLSSWTYEEEITYDIANKTITSKIGWNTYTATMTDTNVSQIKTNNYIYAYVWQNTYATPLVYISKVWLVVY